MCAAVISVIGPEKAQAEAVAAALRERVPGRRFVVGAGPDAAAGVIAVTGGGGGVQRPEDARIVRAVRDAMGGCVLYTGDAGVLADEPGVTVVRWDARQSDSRDLTRLADVVAQLWTDVPRWISDARRADADRIDRVRVVVRLAAERFADELLDPASGQDSSTTGGRARLDALFRARLRCAVLEQGVEWPRLPDPEEVPAVAVGTPDTIDNGRILVAVATSLGAGIAAAVGATTLLGVMPGVLTGVLVGLLLTGVRWRMISGVRRQQSAARGALQLRRGWSAVATEVVARIRIPSVAEAVSREAGARVSGVPEVAS